MTTLLEMNDVVVRFGGLTAVNGATLSLSAHEIHALIGPNGAGKSTVINCISGFQRSSAGEIRLAGKALGRADPATVARSGVARSFQTPHLFKRLTVADNIRVAHRRAKHAAYNVDTLLALVGLDDVADRPAEILSYGRQRLLEVARALATGPRLLLLDEPAAGLSNEENERLVRLLRRIAGEWDLGILIVEHNVPLVRRVADRITVMHHGAVIAQGLPDAVLDEPAVIEAYLGRTREH
ncbi:ABC transporter ATP-binding protein [Bradyrhizobium brasilense]|uniref:ABC transporter ATP-binding protein n=1 Tax=Bradyrhizobium brasilense TaxID=1419277 RepID=UPI00145661A0|nr:ABC transporter ATP-binding protein [Bradyrhizobium brasilense]NLS68170.1 ABC transporter ATP-binding protein [Bradyrhizobium brasilense]